MKKIFYFVLLMAGVLVTSCVKDLDFDQANNLNLTPVYKLAFFKFKVPQTAIDDFGIVEEITEKTAFSPLRSGTVKDNLIQCDISATIDNPSNRRVEINLSFLGESGDPIYEFKPIVVDPGVLNNKFSERIVLNVNPEILKTYFIEFKLKVFPGSGDSPLSNKAISFDSSATLYLRLN